MAIDPYAYCDCGSGKKVKWCNPKAIEQVAQAAELTRRGQPGGALRILEKVAAEAGAARSACLADHCTARTAEALLAGRRVDEAGKLLDKAVEEMPGCVATRRLKAALLRMGGMLAEAEELLVEAAVQVLPEAKPIQAELLAEVGAIQHARVKPIAAWASFQIAARLDPTSAEIRAALEEFPKMELLPNQARHGLKLRSPDELALFNEERRQRWEQARTGERDWHLRDLVDMYAWLSADDPGDVAAAYNLGVARAWAGDEAGAREALDRYVRLEPDFELAADAWDLAELLRAADGMDQHSDYLTHHAVYEMPDPRRFFEKARGDKHLVAIRQDEQSPPVLLLFDKEVSPQMGAVPLLGGYPRQVAQLVLVAPGVLDMVSTSAAALAEAKARFDLLAGDSAALRQEFTQTAGLDQFDTEFTHWFRNEPDDKFFLEMATRYWEEDWIRRPLKSLDGLTPLDAAGGQVAKKKLEGAIRFRERLFARFKVGYDFERLRNRLGIGRLAATVDGQRTPLPIAAYSAAQLAELDVEALADEELAAAYKAANQLDLPSTALKLAAAAVRRDGLATQLDMAALFRRLAAERLERRKAAEAREIVAAALEYDARHYAGAHAAEFQVLLGRSLAAEGKLDEAADLLRTTFAAQPRELDLVAKATEALLRDGAYQPAAEFAQLGLDRAQAARNKSMQEVFREFLAEAKSRRK